MKRILILSCHTGDGHNSCALALKAEFERLGNACDFVDVLSFAGGKYKKLVTSAYNNLIVKSPKSFGLIYKIVESYNNAALPSPIYGANALYAPRLARFIRKNKYDFIISTHLFALETLTWLKNNGLLPVDFYGILTDYACVPFFNDTDSDLSFVGHEDLISECSAKGMDKEKILALGIPVRKEFSENISRTEARILLNINDDRKIILIMTGGMGVGNSVDIVSKLLNRGFNGRIIILTGRNKPLLSKINSLFDGNSRVNSVHFTDKVHIYMKAADILITKAGGISSTEAAVSGIPIVFSLALPGCETYNARFFSQRKMAVESKSSDEAAALALKILAEANQGDAMIQAQRDNINPYAARDIAEYLVEKNG